MSVIPSPAELLAERCRRSLTRFIAEAWPLVEPATPFHPNWHIEAITEYLEAASRGEITRLAINIPPRHMKSLQVSVFWPAWIWLTNPERRFLYASYAQSLSTKHSLMCRRLVASRGLKPRFGEDPEKRTLLERVGYRGLVSLIWGPDAWSLCGDQNRKQRFENTRTGFRLATSVGGSVTGEGGDLLVLDDPHKPEEALSEVSRKNVLEWHDQTWTTRLNDARTGVSVLVMQRLHEEDLTGHIAERGYELLCLPAEYEPNHPFSWPDDPRTEPGEVLWDKWDESWLAEKKSELGSYGYAGQYQQRPSPEEGGIFKRAWWGRYDEEALPRFEQLIASWDMAFKDTDGSDYVVGLLIGAKGADRYLVGMIRARMEFTETVKAVLDLDTWARERWPELARTCLIEDSANGPAVISALRGQVPAMIATRPDGGKEARAHAASPQVEAGNVLLPEGFFPSPPSYDATSVDAFIDELANFPNGAHDDQVDALTQGLNRLGAGPPEGAARLPRGGKDTVFGGLMNTKL